DDEPVRQPGQFDLPQRPADPRVRPGQPRPVGGEGQVAHRAVEGTDQLGDLAAVVLAGAEEQQPAVVGGDGEPLALGVRDEFQDPAQPSGGEPPGGALAAGAGQGGDLDGVLALGVGDVGDLPGRAEHLREPDPHARGVGEGAGGAVAVGEPVQAAADHDGAGPARFVDGDGVQVLCGGHLVAAASGARAAEAHVEAVREGPGGQVVHHPQVAGAAVDDPGAVTGGVAGVEGVVVGVAAQVGAVVGAGVEVADALVVGEEGDAAGAAPVALPGGGFVRRGAGEQQGLAFAVDLGGLDVADRAPGQLAAGAAVAGQLVGPGEVGEGFAVRGDGEDLGVAVFVGRLPAADPGVVAAPVGQPGARAAVDGDHVHLGVEAVPAGVRDVAAVGGETGVAQFGAVHGEPPGPAGTVQRGDPQVVL